MGSRFVLEHGIGRFVAHGLPVVCRLVEHGWLVEIHGLLVSRCVLVGQGLLLVCGVLAAHGVLAVQGVVLVVLLFDGLKSVDK